MRLRSLDLLAFGPFTGVSLDLSAGAPGGFHLIFGANEAGKSTSLRAVKGFFYGIPESSVDAHVHPLNRLRVGATIDSSLFEAKLLRFRRRKNALVEGDGTPFDEERLRQALGFIDESSFERRFGLDQVELGKGAEALLGDREQGLFAAGTAGADVRQLLLELEKEHGELFTKRGRVRPLNQAVQRYREANRSLSDLIKPPELWAEQEASRLRLIGKLDALRESRRGTRLEHVALSRLGSMLSQFAELEEVTSELLRLVAELPGGEPLEATIREKRLGAEAERSEAKRLSVLCQAEITRLEAALSELNQASRLERRSRLLQIRFEATSLRERLGSARSARAALSRLRTRERAALSEVARLLDGAGLRPPGIQAALRGQAEPTFMESAARSLVAPTAAGALRSVLREDEVLRAEENTLTLGVQELKEDLGAEEASAAQETGLDRLDIPWLVQVTQGARHSLEAGGGVTASARALESQTERLRALRGSTGMNAEFAVLEKTALSADERKIYAKEFERARFEARQHEAASLQLRRELMGLEAELKELELGGALPSVEALKRARSARDAALRAALASDKEDPARLEVFERVSTADSISDQLRTDAARIARASELRARLSRAREELEQAETASAEQEAQIAGRAKLLIARLAEAGLEQAAQSLEIPRLIERFAQMEGLLGELEALARRQEEHNQALRLEGEARSRLLSALGPCASSGQELVELRGLVAYAEGLAQRAREAGRIAGERSKRAEAQRRRLSNLEARLEIVRDRRSELASELSHLKRRLGLSEEIKKAELEAILAASEGALVPLTEARQAQQRQEGIIRDDQALADEIKELLLRIAPDIPLDDSLVVADILLERVSAAEREHEEATRLERELAERRSQWTSIRARSEAADATISDLLRATRADDLASLERLEEVSRHVVLLEERKERLKQSLSEKAGNVPVQELRDEAKNSDHRTLFHRLDRMSEELEELNEQVSAVEAELHAVELALARFQTADAAEVRQLVALRGEEVRDLIRAYLVKRTAGLLLGREVSAYASRYAGPLAERSSILFERLTLGKYQRIRIDPLDAEIRCQSGPRELSASELSRGTRAQMYLALRIASLESYFAHHEPIPLVFDDLLVEFDDERAAAAFEVLGELSERVQILYFTHLARDLERASDAIPSRLFRHHRIGS